MSIRYFKKISGAIFLQALFFIFSASLTEAKTLKEHPTIKPFPGSVLSENMSKYSRFNIADFWVKNRQTNQRQTQKVKGEYYYLLYEVKTASGERVRDISKAEFFENYRMAAENMGGEIVYEDSQYLIFTIPGSGGGRTWCKLNVNTGLGQQYLVIVDEKSLKPVMAPGTVSSSSKGMTPVSKTGPSAPSVGKPAASQTAGKVSSDNAPSQQTNSSTAYSSGTVYDSGNKSGTQQINPPSSAPSGTTSLPGRGTANTTPLPSTSPEIEYQSVDKPQAKKLDLPYINLAARVTVNNLNIKPWMENKSIEIEYSLSLMNKGTVYGGHYNDSFSIRVQLINLKTNTIFQRQDFVWAGPRLSPNYWIMEGFSHNIEFMTNNSLGSPEAINDVKFILDVDPNNSVGEAQHHRGDNRVVITW